MVGVVKAAPSLEDEDRAAMSTTPLLEGYLDLEAFAKEVGRDPRTARRWTKEPDGLPFTRIGNRILIHVPTARDWIFGRMRTPNARRATEAALRAGDKSIPKIKSA
jgi:hypothetical protein